MSRPALAVVQATPDEVPGLREAYAAVTAAVARIGDIKRRLPLAEADVIARKDDRDALSSRAARGDAITGADLRKADEAVQDAVAMVTLLTEAGPKAEQEAFAAGRAADAAARPLWERKAAVARAALATAADALADAREAHADASAVVAAMEGRTSPAVNAILAEHGRDYSAEAALTEIERQREVARTRAFHAR